jgi:hypothetical protein
VIGPYKTAGAFRMALEQHLNDRALRTATPVDRLRKEVALQRLLARMVALRPFWSPITSPTEQQHSWDPVAWSWQLANSVELHEN